MAVCACVNAVTIQTYSFVYYFILKTEFGTCNQAAAARRNGKAKLQYTLKKSTKIERRRKRKRKTDGQDLQRCLCVNSNNTKNK